jgi:nucleotide-binding universal stress UspA family protein
MSLLVCVDLSPATERVVEVATGLAVRAQLPLTLLHIAAPEPDFVGYDAGPQTVRDAVARGLRAEHRELEALRKSAESRGIAARALMVQGPTVEKILAQVDLLHPDVVVVGSRGHSLLREAFAGSVTRDLLSHSHVPVLVVPAAS